MLSEGWSQDFPFTNIRGVEGVPHDVPYEGYLVHARSAWKSSGGFLVFGVRFSILEMY